MTGLASADVTVHPDSYTKGATHGVLTFRVPNERSNTSTTKVQVFLPTDHPVLGILTRPHDKWNARTTTVKLKKPLMTNDGTITRTVSQITWTGGKIGPGRYDDFEIAFDKLPDNASELTFKTIQTYANGKITRWTADPTGNQEPKTPAPVLELTNGAPAHSASKSRSANTVTDNLAQGLSVFGLIIGVLALTTLGLAATAWAILRRRW